MSESSDIAGLTTATPERAMKGRPYGRGVLTTKNICSDVLMELIPERNMEPPGHF